MLTLEQWQQPKIEPVETSQILLRFEHIYEKDEDPVLSQPATVNLVSFSLKDGFMIILYDYFRYLIWKKKLYLGFSFMFSQSMLRLHVFKQNKIIGS